MLPYFKPILIKEDNCICQFIYKGNYYTATHSTSRMKPIIDNSSYIILKGKHNEITEEKAYSVKNGKFERFYIDCYIMPKQEYMTCMELYTSQEFEEAVETAFLYLGNPGHLRTDIQGVEGNKLIKSGYYQSIPDVRAVFYKDSKYHYVTTDSFCDVTEHTSFSDVSEFWEYVESTPYIRNLVECPNAKYIGYISKCVNGRYVPEKMTTVEKLRELFSPTSPNYIPSTVVRSEPVMRAYEHPEKNEPPSHPYEYKNGFVWVGITPDYKYAYGYEFNCFACSEKISLRTGGGRYGMLGPFKCPFCGEKYHSGIEDCSPCPRVSVLSESGEHAELVQTKFLMTENEISQVKDIMDRFILAINRIIPDASGDDLKYIENAYNTYREYHDKYYLSAILRCITNVKERDFADNEINTLMDEFIFLYEKIINE